MMASLRSQRVMEIMADATNVIAEGEVLQLMNAHDPDTSEQRYLDVIYRKTARLFEAGAEVAAVLSERPRDVQSALARYGRHLGTAYQLMDDVLDYRSNPSARGKNLGDDLAEGKPTLPLIHALKHGSSEQRAAIREAIKRGGLAQLEPVIAAIDATGGLEYANEVARLQSAQAIALRDRLTRKVRTVAEAQEVAIGGFARIPWRACGPRGEEELAASGISVRCLWREDGRPVDQPDDPNVEALLARAY